MTNLDMSKDLRISVLQDEHIPLWASKWLNLKLGVNKNNAKSYKDD